MYYNPARPIRKVRRVDVKPSAVADNKKTASDIDELIFSDTPHRHSER